MAGPALSLKVCLGAVPLEPLSELGYLDLISQSWNFQSETHWDGLG